ncbi:MAG: tRNA pseudouridine synthase A, partial [Saprospiraceae bacterium]|nr:tRNA pseudouridine synthase A [Saprospiraceae bacterium]
QPEQRTVQGELQRALARISGTEVDVVGCGRTDSGVHARGYVAHFDLENSEAKLEIKGINAVLPDDVAIHSIERVSDDFHARYSCYRREYRYYIHAQKDPFLPELSFRFHRFHKVDPGKLHAAGDLISRYETFYPFCKSHSGVDHYKCHVFESAWLWDEEKGTGVYYVAANRFLRGMVRLLVGAQLNCALGQLDLGDLEEALDKQIRLKKDWSVPAEGLFLEGAFYP